MPGFWGTRLRSLDGVSNAPTSAEYPVPYEGTTMPFRQTLFISASETEKTRVPFFCVWDGKDSRPLFQDIVQACWANHRVMFSTVSP
jgi:hypothetical protein